ncbi:MAG: Lrp/AsnC family transcriptional regulator [Pseudomonadales bacterium]|nr:Lrp/AsnC family transcriptional regulator [Pseudomonadales bacterium]NRA14066.1 Lrp/AsnC family transcriptional regulator [Oceanospirillaceae bacterium]
MKRLKYKNGGIDSVDEQILAILAADARVSVTELARMVSMSGPSVSERIKRLEESGVITNYTVNINYNEIGLPIAAWLRIRPIPGQLQNVVAVIKTIPEIVECDRITGDDCFIARTHLASMEELERVIDQIIPYAMTNTSIIQSSPVKRRIPPLIK